MLKEFELEILKYITRAREGDKILSVLPETFLVDPAHNLFIHLLRQYLEEFGRLPLSVNMDQYINDHQDLSDDVQETLYPLTRKVFKTEFEADTEHLKRKIVKAIQIHQTREMVASFVDKAEEDDQIFDKMFNTMRSILDVSQTLFGSTEARFALKDFTGFNHITYDNVIRSPFPTMNAMMAAGGLFPPQLFVVMAPPKGFKSGIMTNLAVGYMKQGKKVYYADIENGVDDIINRIYCLLSEATYADMTENTTIETLRSVVKFAGLLGGDIYVNSFEMYKGTPAEVRADIERLCSIGWEPDVVIWDYADVMRPSDRDEQRRDKRFQIQSVYGEIKNINKEFKTVSITASQVNRDSFKKATSGMEDIAEDVGKIANADSIWSFRQTEDEAKKDIGRMHPVVQRKGASFTGDEFVYLRVEKDKQLAVEITQEEWMSLVEIDVEVEDDLEDI